MEKLDEEEEAGRYKMKKIFEQNEKLLFGLDKLEPSLEIRKNPQLLKDLTLVEKEVLNKLLHYTLKHSKVFPSHKRLAGHVGCSVSGVKKALNKLKKLQLIDWLTQKEQGHWSTCLYRVAPFLLKSKTIRKVSHIFKALQLALLLLGIANIPKTALARRVATQKYQGDIRNSYIKRGPYRNELLIERRVAKHQGVFKKKFLEKKDSLLYSKESIKMSRESTIHPIVEEVATLFNWNTPQKIKLCIFSEETLKYAYEQLKECGKLRDPFCWYFMVCLNYCKENNLTPDWSFSSLLFEKHNISTDERKGISQTLKKYFDIQLALRNKRQIQSLKKSHEVAKRFRRTSNTNWFKPKVAVLKRDEHSKNYGFSCYDLYKPPQECEIDYDKEKEKFSGWKDSAAGREALQKLGLVDFDPYTQCK